MKKRILYWTVTTVFALLLVSPQAMAGGKGKNGGTGMHHGWEHGKKDGGTGMHHGWDKGKKKGWKSDVPPGHEMKAEKAVKKGSASGEQVMEQAEGQKDKAIEGSMEAKDKAKRKSEKHMMKMENKSGKAKEKASDVEQLTQ